MRTINCRSVCREIEEADLGQQLSGLAIEHTRSCAQCLSFCEDRFKLRQLAASLGTVEAPADFDVRLRARLAKEKPGLAREFVIAGFSFGLPSVALATLALLLGLGAGFLLRVLRPTNSSTSARVETTNTSRPSTLANNQGSPKDDRETGATLNVAKSAPKHQRSEKPAKAVLRTTVAGLRNNGRMVAKDLSSLPAAVVNREESVASSGASLIFPIDASYQSLKVSLDDATGASRTIWLPSVSFGSQRVLTSGSSPMMSTSAKGIW
jgi:hypothetical protein